MQRAQRLARLLTQPLARLLAGEMPLLAISDRVGDGIGRAQRRLPRAQRLARLLLLLPQPLARFLAPFVLTCRQQLAVSPTSAITWPSKDCF